MLRSVLPPFIVLARQDAIGAVAAQHPNDGVAYFPGSIALEWPLDDVHAIVGLSQIPENLEIHQALGMRKALGHDVLSAVGASNEEWGGYRKQVGHSGILIARKKSHQKGINTTAIAFTPESVPEKLARRMGLIDNERRRNRHTHHHRGE